MINELPPLEVISRLNFILILSGLILFTTGIIVGYLYARGQDRPAWRLDIVVILAAISWVFYIVALISTLFPGFRAKRLALGSVAGFLILYFTMIASELFSKFHTFK